MTPRDLDGVFWSVAAGNKAERHWRGGWSDFDGNGLLDWAESDEMNELSYGSDACLHLNWDQYGNSVTDLDLFVVDRYGYIVAQSEGLQDGPQEPAEAVCFGYDSLEAPYGVVVYRYDGPTAGLELTLFSAYNDLEYAVAASSVTDPASAHGAVAVAAIFTDDFAGSNPPAEPYSSQGPTTDGRGKPDLAAPDGTSSFTYGPKGAYGTSFAAPVVAGAAALRLQYDPQLDAAALEQFLFDNAIDVGDPGHDPTFGYGKIYLPEPASWLMMVAGTGLLGMLRRLRGVG